MSESKPHVDPIAGGEAARVAAALQTPKEHRFVGHAIVVAIMTLLSRFTGLIRDSVLAAVLGLSAIADAFAIGFLIPNLFRRLFGEGALTAAFIPVYTDLLRTDKLAARRLATLCIAAMLVFLGLLVLVGEAVLAWMLAAFRFTEETSLALKLTMIMLPYMPMICIVALVGGILQVHGKFGAPAAAPIFLNIVMIIGTIVAAQLAQDDVRQAVVIISYTILIAGLVQLVWQIGVMLRVEKFDARYMEARPALRQLLVMAVPMFIGLGVFQINTLFDYVIAFGLSAKEGGTEQLHLLGMTLDYPVSTGDVAALQWAQRLYQFPLGVFGLAVATAIFPALARAAGEVGSGLRVAGSELPEPGTRNPEPTTPTPSAFQTILHHGLRLTFFIGLPASVGLILLRIPITRLIYERGEFSLADSQRVAFIMIGYSAVVWAYSMTHVLTRAFYAVKDARTPLRVSLWMVGVNLALNLALVWPLGVAGLAWASAAAAALQVIMLMRAIRRYAPHPIGADVLRSWKLTVLLTLAMAAVLLPAALIWDAAAMTRTQSALQLLLLLPIGAGLFLGGAYLLHADELKWLKRRRKETRS
ncbi:MAG: murein biosynthesis integral membrane protein MurJ [Phycisphaeraceae bacterium]